MKKNVTKLLMSLLILASINVIPSSIFGQKTIYLDTVDNICKTGSIVNISIRAKNLSNIFSIGGSIRWDTAVMKYSSFIAGSNPAIRFAPTDIGTLSSAQGILRFSYGDPNGLTGSVPDTTALCSFLFTIKKVVVGHSALTFSSSPTTLEIDTADANGQNGDVYPTAKFISSYVGFVSQPTISKGA
ncbi:cohesin domain-containing protein, partial [Parasediminibacterium sp. JCM 36343]|uniref:cohesin domain-containing protein n=1 Tax=Parasediminibacterium sp. JCM 36343 TaxID=3374279 RepID=UPI00397DAD68